METVLRPMSLGEILDRTATIYRKNFLLLAGISAIYAGIVMLISLLQLFMNSYAIHWGLIGKLLVSFGALIILLPVFLIAGFTVAAINRAVAWIHLNQNATIRSAYASVWPRLGRLLWLMFLYALRIYWPIVIAVIPAIVLVVLIPGVRTGDGTNDMGSLALMGVLGLLTFVLITGALVYMVWEALRLALSVPSCIVEDLKATEALRRSIELTKGARGRIFVLGLLVAVIQLGLSFMGMIPFFVFGFRQAMANHGQIGIGIQALQQCINFVITTFVTPIYSTGFMLFYYDQRVRKEGFDIEWMMQSAGLGEPVRAVVGTTTQPPTAAQVGEEG